MHSSKIIPKCVDSVTVSSFLEIKQRLDYMLYFFFPNLRYFCGMSKKGIQRYQNQG